MKKLMFFSLVILITCSAGTALASGFALGLRGSTLGAGVEANYRFNEYLSITGGANWFEYDFDFSADNVDYDASLDLQSFLLLVNFHPFGSGFHLTGGFLSNGNEASLTGAPDLDEYVYVIGDVTYSVDDVGSLTGTASFDELAGYAGLGWGYEMGQRFGLTADFGVVFQGEPAVTLEANGILAADVAFQEDLEEERAQIEDELSWLQFYPVVSLGFYVRF